MENIFKKNVDDPTYAIKKHKRTVNKSVEITFTILRLLILLAIGYIILYPLMYMIVTSLKARSEYYSASRVWIPTDIDLIYNYTKAWELLEYGSAMWSTFSLEIIAAVLEIVSCSIAAYGFARFNFKLKGVMIAGLFLTILIPEAMIMVPRMVNYSNIDFLGIIGIINKISGSEIKINLIDTPLSFYLPSFFAIGLRSGILIYIYIQFFKSLPKELEEAAWVDGAGPIRTFIKIALPSSSVVFTTVTVFSVVWHWNDTLLSSMYLKSNYPLAVLLSRIEATLSAGGLIIARSAEVKSIMMAACILFILPILLFYMILQKRFIESIDRVGITG